MLIDCETCVGLNTTACDDCVVSFILHEGLLDLDQDEVAALEALADEGLVPRLRLVVSPVPTSRALGPPEDLVGTA
jgi:hypothetical protein